MMDDFKEVDKCPVCKCADFNIVFSKERFKGKKCVKCSLIYISPIRADLKEIYTNDKTSSPSRYYTLSYKHDISAFTNRVMLLEKYIPTGRFLDVGCSVGSMLAAAGNRGWDVSGIEPNPVSAEICRKKNINVYMNFLDEEYSEKYSEYYNAVYIGDVIEHVENPLKTISLALKMLKPNGVLMIVTPDFDSYTARIFQIKPLEHILYFNSSSIKNMMLNFDVKTELLMKTTRKRSLKALVYSTTFSEKPLMKKFLKVLYFAGLDPIINFFTSQFIRDELLLIARKI